MHTMGFEKVIVSRLFHCKLTQCLIVITYFKHLLFRKALYAYFFNAVI